MNSYQKAGTWAARLIGTIIGIIGLMGPAYASIARAIGAHVSEYPTERWIGSLFWGIGGIALVLAARPIGRMLGRGLD